MAHYINPNGKYPPINLDNLKAPGIFLPADFALEASDRTLVGPGNVGQAPQAQTGVLPETTEVRFPSRDVDKYGEAIARLVGAFSGPGFNIIFRPHSDKTEDKTVLKLDLPAKGSEDDLLELNLTHELWTFPSVSGFLGDVPNRVAKLDEIDKPNPREDVILFGVPYTQIVRDVTDTASADKGTRVEVDRLGNAKDINKKDLVNDIHFEPGLFVHVKNSVPVSTDPTISRMASIPHGTTINCQGQAAIKIDNSNPPNIKVNPLNPNDPKKLQNPEVSKPFSVGTNGPRIDFNQFDLTSDTATRLPQKMKPFTQRNSVFESITERMVKDPNFLINSHNEGKKFSQVVQFTVSTAPSAPLEQQACPHLAARKGMNDTSVALNNIDKSLASNLATIDKAIAATATQAVNKELTAARAAIADALKIVNDSTADIPVTDSATAPAIGSANIAFLDGKLGTGMNPNARTGKVEATFWISTVVYTVNVTQKFEPGLDRERNPKVLKLDPVEMNLPQFAKVKDTIPTFVFPTNKVVEVGTYEVEATQIQYSQTVNLIFNTLVWPHISVATVIPVRPVLVNTAKVKK